MPRRTQTVTDPLSLLSEREFQATVIETLKRRGWRYIHHYNSRRSVPGWPDVFAVRGDRAIALELKREDGRTTPSQDEWLDALEAAGIEVHVCYPSGLDKLRIVLE